MVFHAILKFRVHISERSIISLWSPASLYWVRGYHQKTHYEAGTYLYLSQSSWLIVLGHDWKHVSCVNNKINEQSAFKNNVNFGCKILVLLLMKVRVNLNSSNGTSFHTFPLVEKAHVMTYSLSGETGNQYSSNMADDFARWWASWKKRSFSELNKIFQRFLGISSERKTSYCFFKKRWPFIRQSRDEKRVVGMFGKLRYEKWLFE